MNASYPSSTITQAFAQAMKSVLLAAPYAESLRSSVAPHTTTPGKKHALLAATDPTLNFIDARPHVKSEWTIGQRLKFSCTVYYAQQFDSPEKEVWNRRYISEEHVQIEAMVCGRGEEQGELLEDRRRQIHCQDACQFVERRRLVSAQIFLSFVARVLLISECRQVLIDLAPAYFRYMDGTTMRASVWQS